MNRPSKRIISDEMIWSQRCREHFLPWRSKAAESLRDGEVAEAGISDIYPGYRLGRTHPRFHLLVFSTLGHGTVKGERFEGRTGPGELLIIPAETPFGYRPWRKRWRFLWFHLPATPRWASLEGRPIQVRAAKMTAHLDYAMEGFLHECRTHAVTSARAASLLGELITLYIERELGNRAETIDTGAKYQLFDLWERVRTRLKHPWSAETLAKELGVSVPHLHRLVSKHSQTSPMKMVTRLRMERAQELLILYDSPIRVISEMVGYQNEFAFAVSFKRFSGVTPGQFRLRR